MNNDSLHIRIQNKILSGLKYTDDFSAKDENEIEQNVSNQAYDKQTTTSVNHNQMNQANINSPNNAPQMNQVNSNPNNNIPQMNPANVNPFNNIPQMNQANVNPFNNAPQMNQANANPFNKTPQMNQMKKPLNSASPPKSTLDEIGDDEHEPSGKQSKLGILFNLGSIILLVLITILNILD